jgi:hypothetical protein
VCKRPNNVVTAADGSNVPPIPGDLTVCFSCGSFLTFNDDLTRREMSLDEVAAFKDSQRIELQRVRKRCLRLKESV